MATLHQGVIPNKLVAQSAPKQQHIFFFAGLPDLMKQFAKHTGLTNRKLLRNTRTAGRLKYIPPTSAFHDITITRRHDRVIGVLNGINQIYMIIRVPALATVTGGNPKLTF
jgi:hypothetical protein